MVGAIKMGGDWRSPTIATVAILTLFVATVSPVQSACSLGCGTVEGSQGVNYYKAGQTYTYNLETEMAVQLSGHDPQETAVRVQAQVMVSAGQNCEHSLQVRKFSMWTEVAGQKAVAQKLSKEIEASLEKPVRFSMKGQKIGQDICADDQDTEFSLNVKRGLISLLQGHPVERGISTEYDVFGKCLIDNSDVTTSGDATQIFLKRKDLTKCEGREHFTATGLVRSVFNSNSDVKSTPIMSGDYSLEHRIKNGQTYPEFIQLTEFYEVATLKQFIKANVEATSVGNRIKSKVVSKLVFLNAKGGNPVDVKSPATKSIRFESLPNAQQSTMNILKAKIKSMIDSGFGPNGNVQEFLAEQFLQLVRLMRDTKKDDLLSLFQQVKSGNVHENRNLARKLYFDALFRANSGDSAEAISTLVSKNMDPAEQKMAYMALQFTGQLNKDSLMLIQKLLDFNPNYEAYLVAGTLVQKYCEQYECTSAKLKPIMDKFANGLKCNGKMDKKAEHLIIAILKGLKNSEQISIDSVLDKIYNCYQESVKVKRVRVQSVKTMAAAVCHTAKGRDILKTILKEKTVDPEFRIHAYLGLIKNCPNAEMIGYLQGIYNSEETNQLVGFLRTHIQSLKMTTDPGRQKLKSLVQEFDLSKHSILGVDFRKTSFNYEHSYNLDSLGVGGSVDTNVIFTKNGFLPRSMNFNFSAELFGRDFNFLELELRQENMESIGEHFFGPRGWFTTKTNQEIVDKIEQTIDEVEKDTNLNVNRFNYRRRRDAINLKDESIKFNKGLQNTDQDLNTDLDLDLSINMFGSEVKFLALSELDFYKKVSGGDTVKTLTKMFNDALEKAKNWEHSCEAYHLLMDTEFEYPTGIGIPLKARSQIAMATKLGSSLKFDLRDFLFSKKPSDDVKFQIELAPSLSVAGHAGLYLDTGVQQLGLQLNGNLYTSMNGALDFKIQEQGHRWNMDFHMKDRKQEFVKFDHKIIFVQQDKGALPTETPLKFHAKKTDFVACFDQVYPHTGVTFCADYSFSVPDHKTTTMWTAMGSLFSTPLNGPNRLGLWVEVDPVYNFQLMFQNKVEPGINMHSVEFMWDCPHKQYNRQIKIRAEAGLHPKTYVKVALISPIRSSSAEVGFKDDAKEVIVYAEAEDDNKKYLAKFGLQKSGGREYTPILLIQYPDHTDKSIFGYTITGKIFVDRADMGTVYTFNNLEIRQTKDSKDVASEPIIINGKVEYIPISFKVDMETVRGGSRVAIKGNLNMNPQNFLIDFKTESNNQNLNGEIYYNFQYEKNALVAQAFKLKIGSKKEYDVMASERIEFDKALIESKKTEDFWGAITKLEVKAEWTPVHPGNFLVTYDNDKNANYGNVIKFHCKELDLHSNFAMKKSAKVDYDMNYSLTVNKFFIKVLSKVGNESGGAGDDTKKSFVNKVSLSNGFAFDLNGNFMSKMKSGDFELDFINQLTDNTKKPQYKVAFKLKSTLKQLNWNLKVNLMAQPTDLIVATFTLKKNEQFDLDMVVRDIVHLNADYKFSELKPNGKDKSIQSVNFKGEGFVLLKFPKIENYQMKVDTKFLFHDPKYDLHVEFFYDFERDNTKKAIFDTQNVIKKNEMQTKNSLVVMGDKYEMNGEYEMIGTIDDGKINWNGIVILPSTRQFSADFKRVLNRKVLDAKTNDASYSGSIDLVLKDQNAARQQRLISVNGKLAEMHARTGKYDVHYKIELQDYDKKNIIIEPTAKADKGEQLDLGLSAYGQLLPERFTASLNLKNEFKKRDQVNFSIKLNYGASVTGTSIGHLKLMPGGTNFDYKIYAKLNVDSASLARTIPGANMMSKFKSAEANLVGKSSGKFEQNFEWHFSNEAKINDATKYHANVDLMGNPESFFNTKVSLLAESVEATPVVLEVTYMINPSIEVKEVEVKKEADQTDDVIPVPSKLSKLPVYMFFKNGGEFSTKLNYRGNEEVKVRVLLDKKQPEFHILTGHMTSTVPALKDHKIVIKVKQFEAPSLTKLRTAVNADYFNGGSPWYQTYFAVDSNPTSPSFEIMFDNVRVNVKSVAKMSSKINQEANQFYGELQLSNLPMKDFDFHGKMDWTNYQFVSTDPIRINIKADCEKFNLKGMDMTFKGTRAGSKIQMEVSGRNAGKEFVNGQLDVAEGASSAAESSVILEGTGNLKWQDGAKRKVTFQLLRKKFAQNQHHMEFLLNGQLDQRNFLFEFKHLEGMTIGRHSICMDGDQRCTNIELKSHRKSASFNHFEHDFVVNFDVRPWGGFFDNYYNNLGMSFNTKKIGFEFGTDFNLFVENQHRKYQVSANSKNQGTNMHITYPGRTIAMEVTHKLPTVQEWKFDFGTLFWLNKEKKADNRFELRTVGGAEMNRERHEWTMKFSAFANHPKMKKIAIDGQSVWNFDLKAPRFTDSSIVFDVFQRVEDKVTIQVVSTKELQPTDHMRWDLAVKMSEHGKVTQIFKQEYYVSLKKSEAVIKITLDYPKKNMLNIDVNYNGPKGAAKFEMDLMAQKVIDSGLTIVKSERSVTGFLNVYHLGKTHPCVKVTGKMVSYQHISLNIECDHLATVTLDYDLQKAVGVQIVDTAKKTELFVMRVQLDQKSFLDTQYKLNSNEIEAFLKSVQVRAETEMQTIQADMKMRVTQIQDDLKVHLDQLVKKLPDVKELGADYKTQLTELYKEIQEDPTLKHIFEFIQRIGILAWEMSNEFMKTVIQFGARIFQICKDFGMSMWQTIKENILPHVLEFLASLREIGKRLVQTVWGFLQRLVQEFNTFFGKYQEDLNKIFKQLAQQLRDLFAIGVKFTSQLRAELENIINTLLNFAKDSLDIKGLLNRIGKLLREYKYDTYVKQLSAELIKMVDDNKLLTPETKQFLDALIKYVTSKLTDLEVQSAEAEFTEIKQLGRLLVDALKSMYGLIKSMWESQRGEVTKSNFYNTVSQMSVDSNRLQEFLRQNFITLPLMSPVGVVSGQVPASHLKFQWSGLNYLFSGEFYKSIFKGDWSKVWEFSRVANLIPPYTYQAQIIDGAHFMTFDGLHYTFAVSGGAADATEAEPEGCYFVLLADSQHSNFTVLATFNNGLTRKMNSIMVIDDANNVIELKSNDKLYYNNKAKDLPVHQDIHAWRNYFGQTEIEHANGVHLMCERKLELCTITVNGYYKNKLRGLLGNANDERIDELQLQNGDYVDIHASSYDPFYQNYQLKKFNKQCPQLVSTAAGADVHGHHHQATVAECDAVFKNFAYFETVLPWFDNYKEACQHAVGIAGGSGNKVELACSISRGFVRKLRSEYSIPVRTPSVCHTECVSEKNEAALATVSNKKLDLLLLIDFNNTMYAEMLTPLMAELKASFRAYQIQDPEITLIGFNKDWVYPVHFSAFDPKMNVAEVVKEMPLRSDSYFKMRHLEKITDQLWANKERLETELSLSSDAQAFQYAFQYPFRPDAIKAMMIFRSEPLKYTANVVKTASASLMNNLSAARGIQMHLMTPVEEFTLTGGPANARNAKLVIGFNEKVVIQNADAKKKINVGATNLRQSVQYKEDMGTDLVLSSNEGNNYVFLAQNYGQRNAKDKKVFVQAMVNAVTEQMPRLVIQQQCFCSVTHGLYEHDVCRVKDVSFLAQAPKRAAGRG